MRMGDRAKAMVAVPWVKRFPLMPSISPGTLLILLNKYGLQASLDFKE